MNTDKTILVIEDFHNIKKEVQEQVGPALKEASERELKTCVLVIKHKSDVLIDAVDDLTDRVESINFEHWETKELRKIGELGFYDALNLQIPEKFIDELAKESIRSPYLMQKLCFNACPIIGYTEQQETATPIDVTNQDIEMTLRQTASSLENSYGKIFHILNGDSFTGGGRRNEITFTDGSTGDIYRAMMRAIAADPIQTSFKQSELISRINDEVDFITRVSDGEQISRVNTGSVISAYQNVDKKLSEIKPKTSVLDWDEDKKLLSVGKTGLILYLRWSGRMDVDRSIDVL